MMKFIVPSFVAAMLIFTSACATSNTGGSAMDAKAASAISAAKAAKKKAASVGGEWTQTGKMIKKAEKLAKEGKTAQAIKLAKKAETQGHNGYQQMADQKTVGIRMD